MKLYSITAVKHLRGRERVHSATTYLVMAESEDAAKGLFEQEECDEGTRFCFVSKPREVGNIQSHAHHTYTPAQVDKMKGIEPEAPKPKAERKPSSRPLGETQVAVLRSLKEHGGWPKGWLWDTESGTQRICESLYQRCLAEKEIREGWTTPFYTVSSLGEQELQKLK